MFTEDVELCLRLSPADLLRLERAAKAAWQAAEAAYQQAQTVESFWRLVAAQNEHSRAWNRLLVTRGLEAGVVVRGE